MADATGKDRPPIDTKTSGKSGPVKPPVLEGTARPTGSAKPVGATTEKSGTKAEPPKPVAPPRKSDDHSPGSGAPWFAGLLGGIVGLGAAYGLAWAGLWPGPAPIQPTTDPHLAQLATTVPELQTIAGTVQDELATLGARIDALEAAAPPAATADLGVFEAQLTDLAQRLDALPSQSPPVENDGAAVRNAEAIAVLQADLAALQEQGTDNAAQLRDVEAAIATLDALAGAAADSNNGTAQLPLILSGLEAAFGRGSGYVGELSALRTALPGAAIPESLSARAAIGLPRPDDVERRLAGAIPDMLAGRPLSADGDWQQATLDWFRGTIAMRPTGTVEGDDPEAIVSRLEAAVAREDFAAAESELAALPASMRAPAQNLAEDIAVLAAADAFITQLRVLALSGEAGR